MKDKIIIFLLMLVSWFQLFLIRESGIINIILGSGFFMYFFIKFINCFLKKKNKIHESIFKFIIFLNIIYSLVSIFTSSVKMGLYGFVVSSMGYYLFNKIFKNKDNMNKLLITVYLLVLLPGLLLQSINYNLLYLIIFGLFLVIYFYKKSDKKKKPFKLYTLYKYISIISVAVLYLYYPIVGGVLAGLVGVLAFGGAFEIYIKKKEDTLYNKEVRNNPKFILTKKIFHYAPSKNEFFNNQMKRVGNEAFLEDGVPYELYAIMAEINDRSKDKKLVLNFKNKDELVEKMTGLLDTKVRPDVVTYMIMEGIKIKDNLTETEKDKLYKKLEKVLNNFEVKYVKTIESDDENILEKVEDLYSKFSNDLKKLVEKLNIKSE